MKKLILIRGVSGSGKTTLAEKILGEQFCIGVGEYSAAHIETDMYFTSPAGIYTFVPHKIEDAHKWCQTETEYFLSQDFSVIVSNTFTRKWEMQPYIDMAEKHGVNIEIIEATGNYKNVHGVPEDVVQRMRDRWEVL